MYPHKIHAMNNVAIRKKDIMKTEYYRLLMIVLLHYSRNFTAIFPQSEKVEHLQAYIKKYYNEINTPDFARLLSSYFY